MVRVLWLRLDVTFLSSNDLHDDNESLSSERRVSIADNFMCMFNGGHRRSHSGPLLRTWLLHFQGGELRAGEVCCFCFSSSMVMCFFGASQGNSCQLFSNLLVRRASSSAGQPSLNCSASCGHVHQHSIAGRNVFSHAGSIFLSQPE